MPGPANLYGVANAIAAPNIVTPPSDVVITHDVWTTIVSTPPLIAITPGNYWINVFANFAIQIGATSIGGLNAAVSVNNGAAQLQLAWDYRVFQANLGYILSAPLSTATSNTLWNAPGSTVQIQLYPFTQNITVHSLGSWLWYTMVRGPDV